MSAATPVLGGVSLPQVSAKGYKETSVYLGGQIEMASGSYAYDLLSTESKRRFELAWVGMTASQVATIRSGWATVAADAAEFTPPLGSIVDVQRDGDLTVNWYPTAQGLLADVALKLREV